MRRLLPALLALAVAGGLLVLDRDGGGESGDLADGTVGRVVRVVDGDTVQVRLGSTVERVRYVGIDTPESVRPNTPVQCFARAAAAANARLVAGAEVRLRTDIERRDRFGRLLAYVYRVSDGRFVNAELVRDGYARTLTIPPNVRHAARLAVLARQARAAGRGLWRACGS